MKTASHHQIRFAIGLFAFYSATAYAIAPDKHLVVTGIAFKEYQQCLQQLSVPDTLGSGADQIIEYSGLEDTSPLLKRYFNWHFYDAYRDTEYAMGRSVTGARTSLHHIFDERVDALISAIEDQEEPGIHEYTGRVLHYIQDMTVPTHVAPIYHHKFLWFDQSDYFDEMSEWESAAYTPPKGLCRHDPVTLEDAEIQLNRILDDTATMTRNRITQPISVQQGHPLYQKTWQEFWIIRNPADDSQYADTKPGFAPYGPQGREGFEKLCKSSGDDRLLCLGFFNDSFGNAISATVKVLLMINDINLQSRDP